jgi:hypothetical protein
MRAIILCILCAGITALPVHDTADTATRAKIDTDTNANEKLFDNFVTTFGKVYESEPERASRFGIFSDNAVRVAAMNAADPHAEYSLLTPWADMTLEEYARMHGLLNLGSDSGLPCQFAGKGKVPKLVPTASPLSSLDYVAQGATVEVKNQGKCGSCWAHATTAVVEARMKLDTGNITSLSEQYLLDCDAARLCQACCGGLAERALQWLAGDSGGLPGEGQGIPSEAAYPYSSGSGKDPTSGHCNHGPPLVAKLKGFGVLASPSPTTVVSASTQYGVLATSMDSRVLQFYKSGIITNFQNCSLSNHAVAIVGYGTESGVDFLKVRNSYGIEFGESGYFRIARQAGQAAAECGLYSCVIAGTAGSALADMQ